LASAPRYNEFRILIKYVQNNPTTTINTIDVGSSKAIKNTPLKHYISKGEDEQAKKGG